MDALHPTDQTLRSFGLGKLDDASARLVSEHLEACADCREGVAEASSDSFLNRVREARKGVSRAGAAAAVVEDALAAGLADHPDYEIRKELGRGGMGVVYLAQNRLLGRDEVLKVMGRHLMDRAGVLDRFLREMKAVARLRHPNIVAAYSATRVGDSFVFAMEHVEGLDLSKLVKAKGPLPVAHACNFVYQAALGLQHAHEEGLVHRDIKPANLMLSRKGNKATVKVLDFGLAKAVREEKVDGGLTYQGQALGTPDFIAPEQILNAPDVDIRADVYSLGGTLYFLLTGRPPFRANSLYDIYQAHISREADPLNLVRPEVPAELAALVAKMMAKEPGRRFSTPGEAAEALKPFFQGRKTAFPAPRPEISQAGLAATNPRTAADSIPPRTVGGVGVERAKTAVETSRWESLIDFREDEPKGASPLVARVEGRTPRRWWPSALAASVFGLLAAGVIVFTIRDKDGREIARITAPEGSSVTESPDGVGKPSTPDPKATGLAKPRVTSGPEAVKEEKAGLEGPKLAKPTVAGEPGGAKEKEGVGDREAIPTQPPGTDKAGAALAITTKPSVPKGWQPSYPVRVVWGKWSMSGDEVGVKPTGSHSAIVVGPLMDLDEFTFEAEVKRIEGDGAIELNVGDVLYRTFGLSVKQGRETVFRRNFGKGNTGGDRDFEKTLVVDHERWNHLKVEQKNKVFTYSVNHEVVFQEPNEQIRRGRFTLATVLAVARFREIKVTGPGGKVLIEGLPKLPEANTPETIPADPNAGQRADYDAIATGRWIPVLDRELDLNDRRVVVPGYKGGDVIIRARVRKLTGQHLAIALRRDEDQPAAQGYSVWFNGGNWFGIHRFGAGQNDLGQWRAGPRYDGFFELAFSAVGDRLTFYADGKRIGEVFNADHRSGSFAIGALRGRSVFQNVEIMILDKTN